MEELSIEDDVQSLGVDVGAGDVTIRGEDVHTVAVRARVEGDANHLGHTLEGGRLQLFDECHDDPCSVDIVATVPAGVPVVVHTGSGDVLLDELLGTVSVRTGAGDVEGFGLGGTDVVTTTGAGDVVLDVATPAERVQVRTGAGDVLLDVPSGSYAVSIDTGSGDTSVRGVRDDAGAPGSLEITTGSGDVTIRGY